MPVEFTDAALNIPLPLNTPTEELSLCGLACPLNVDSGREALRPEPCDAIHLKDLKKKKKRKSLELLNAENLGFGS